MKWVNRAVAVIVVLLTLNVFVQPGAMTSIGKRMTNAMDLPGMLKTEIDRATKHVESAQNTQNDSNATPIENIVQGRTLSNHYYY